MKRWAAFGSSRGKAGCFLACGRAFPAWDTGHKLWPQMVTGGDTWSQNVGHKRAHVVTKLWSPAVTGGHTWSPNFGHKRSQVVTGRQTLATSGHTWSRTLVTNGHKRSHEVTDFDHKCLLAKRVAGKLGRARGWLVRLHFLTQNPGLNWRCTLHQHPPCRGQKSRLRYV